ncbi:Cysteine-rich RLK (RECEPTOR-like protein kinase) 8 [Hibiscus syriacus]|uniref:Cysteine-rich RLK (RECEPTOR-like protein kinase) 8 n=1 Tax=Hibiscus syriacus TaxID=106335 RepID=A0A6A3BU33_HIBSY|nr:Cysteine-rich RLK (RECEPTOR-like protein kinase) 8 [Hibiscus syriacus]
MAGRRKRRLKLLAETVNGDERTTTEDGNDRLELQTWSSLPVELLDLIMSSLSPVDNIRASAVCKNWHKSAVSVRVTNQSPWLMYFPRGNYLYEFYDPSECKIYYRELPELRASRVCHSRDGWLLYRPRTQCVFFFNPFTRERIDHPSFELTSQGVAFSCAPTSTNCVVFTMTHVTPLLVAISMCHPGALEWTTFNHPNRFPFVSSFWDKVVFSNGAFYCLSFAGWVGIYYHQTRYWKVLGVPPPRCPEIFFLQNWWKGKFLTERNGDILVIYTSQFEKAMVYKLCIRGKPSWCDTVCEFPVISFRN